MSGSVSICTRGGARARRVGRQCYLRTQSTRNFITKLGRYIKHRRLDGTRGRQGRHRERMPTFKHGMQPHALNTPPNIPLARTKCHAGAPSQGIMGGTVVCFCQADTTDIHCRRLMDGRLPYSMWRAMTGEMQRGPGHGPEGRAPPAKNVESKRVPF